MSNTGLVNSHMGGAAHHYLNKDEVTIDAIWTIEAPLDKEQWENAAKLFTDFSAARYSR